MSKLKIPTTDELLQATMRGEQPDWRGQSIDGSLLSGAIRTWAAAAQAPPALSFTNATIQGDVTLDLLSNQRRLQIMKCHWKGGLRARGSSWGALLVIDTSLNFVDLNQASIDGSLVRSASP
jgi:hypothetical protein